MHVKHLAVFYKADYPQMNVTFIGSTFVSNCEQIVSGKLKTFFKKMEKLPLYR
jgi:hypothetical protein